MKREEYIKELKECIETHSKINEILGKTKELKEYLRGMEISEEYVESAATVEIIRNRLKSMLLTEECEITEKGIKHNGKEFKINEDGSIAITEKEGFKVPNENGEICYYKDLGVAFQSVIINKFGAIISSSEVSKPPYTGEYYIVKRDDEKNIITIESSDGYSYETKEEKTDLGNPIDLNHFIKFDFETTYEKFVQEFPKLKYWYDYKYPGVNGNKEKFEEITKNITVSLEQKELDRLVENINRELKLIEMQDEKGKSAIERYQLMVDSISQIGKKSEIGRRVSNMLMKKVDKSILEKSSEKSQEIEDKEEIIYDKNYLEKRLQDLKILLANKEADTTKIHQEIKRLETQIQKIPVMGKNIIKKTKKAIEAPDRNEK